MSSARITLTDVDGATEVEMQLSDANAESPAVIMATYLHENWDVICEACRRHLVLRQNAIDKSDAVEAPKIQSINPKIIDTRGYVISRNDS